MHLQIELGRQCLPNSYHNKICYKILYTAKLYFSFFACNFQALEKHGVIEKYSIIINPEKIGNTLAVFFDLKISAQDLNAVCETLKQVPQVTKICHSNLHLLVQSLPYMTPVTSASSQPIGIAIQMASTPITGANA